MTCIYLICSIYHISLNNILHYIILCYTILLLLLLILHYNIILLDDIVLYTISLNHIIGLRIS